MAETEDFLRVHDKRYIEARERGVLLETQGGVGAHVGNQNVGRLVLRY